MNDYEQLYYDQFYKNKKLIEENEILKQELELLNNPKLDLINFLVREYKKQNKDKKIRREVKMNIIEELEKWLINYGTRSIGISISGKKFNYAKEIEVQKVLDKIYELKTGDDNE